MLNRILGMLTFLAIFLGVMAVGLYAMPPQPIAAAAAAQIRGPYVVVVVTGTSFDGDVRNLPAAPSAPRGAPEVAVPAQRVLRAAAGVRPPAPSLPGTRLRPSAPAGAPLIAANFMGISQTSFPSYNAWPPDPTGDVGSDNYVQAVNRSIGIYDKAGTRLAAFAYHSLFAGTGTLCDTNPRDDPAVVYDSLKDRWMFTLLARSA